MAPPVTAPILTPARQDTWRVKLWTEGKDRGVFDKKSGGMVDSEERIYHPGSMAPAISLGGRRTTEQITLSRIYDHNWANDHLDALLSGCGNADITIAQRVMSFDRSTRDHYIQYKGTLKSVTFPDHDSEGNDPAMIEIVCSISSTPEYLLAKTGDASD